MFDTGRFAPGTREGRRLLAHELTHVRQQSTGLAAEAVQRQPSEDPWSLFESTFGGEPRFVFWAKRNGKPPANHGQEMALLDAYRRVEKNKEVLEAYDQAQLAGDRSVLDTRRQAARAAGKAAAEARFAFSRKQRESAREQTRPRLHAAIMAAWQERRTYELSENVRLAKADAAQALPYDKALRKHWRSDQERWVYLRQYLRTYGTLYPELFGPNADDDVLAHYAVSAEENYLAMLARDTETTELAQYRYGNIRWRTGPHQAAGRDTADEPLRQF